MKRIISSRQAVKALRKVGFVVVGRRGEHIYMHNSETDITLVLPVRKELKRGTLHHLLEKAGLSVEGARELT